MSTTVIIKIALADGAIEIKKLMSEAKSFVERISTDGYLDPVTGQFHSPQSILRIEVGPPEQFGEGWFSEN